MTFPIAAIVSSVPAETTGLLIAFTRQLQAAGHRVRGLVQELQPGAAGCDIVLLDLESGERHPVTQNLGQGSAACRLDPARLTEAGHVLRAIPGAPTDLAVCNRFGALEAQGDGFCSEMLAIMGSGTPLLTVVSEKHLADWRRFTGGLGSELTPERRALDAWFASLTASTGDDDQAGNG